MRKVAAVIALLSWLGVGRMVNARELLPFESEGVEISTSGVHSLRIDDRLVDFEVPVDLPTKAGRASEVVSRGEKHDEWLKRKGEYTKSCFSLSWDFHSFGIPMLGSRAQFSISAQLHVKASPANRDNRYTSMGRGDFSKPEELRAYMERLRGDTNHTTPVGELIINSRKWYHYYRNSQLYPDDLEEYYVTGLAPDRFLRITIRQYPVPFSATRYPTYPAEDQRPPWLKMAFKYRGQVISSLRITKPEGSKGPDLYEVGT